jgi:hypothetical protein
MCGKMAAMTIDEARGHIGDGVVYRSGTPRAEEGVITSVNARFAFVRYGSQTTTAATDPADLDLLAPGSEQEADAEAWGGRGPSASYAEWVAEGQAEGDDGPA